MKGAEGGGARGEGADELQVGNEKAGGGGGGASKALSRICMCTAASAT